MNRKTHPFIFWLSLYPALVAAGYAAMIWVVPRVLGYQPRTWDSPGGWAEVLAESTNYLLVGVPLAALLAVLMLPFLLEKATRRQAWTFSTRFWAGMVLLWAAMTFIDGPTAEWFYYYDM